MADTASAIDHPNQQTPPADRVRSLLHNVARPLVMGILNVIRDSFVDDILARWAVLTVERTNQRR